MLNYFKGKWHVATASLLLSLAATAVHADSDSAQMRNLDNRVTALEQRRMSSGVINPSARPPVKESVDIGIELEALYLWSYEGGVYPATTSTSSTDIAGGKTQKIGPKGNWGFSVEADYVSSHDDWDISLNWMWFQGKLHRNIDASATAYVFPNMTNPSAYFNVLGANASAVNICYQSMNSHSRTLFNNIELMLGRPSYMSKNLSVNFEVGLQATWLHNHTNVSYNNMFTAGAFVPNSGYELKATDDTFGMGVKADMETVWYFTNNFSLFGKYGAALLYGFHSTSRDDTFDNGAGPGTSSSTRVMPHSNSLYTETEIGLSYADYFADDCYRWEARLGWNQMQFTNFNQNLLFTGSSESGKMFTNQGDYSLQGISLSVSVDF